VLFPGLKWRGIVLSLLLASSTVHSQLKEGAWGIKADLGGSTNLGIAYCLQPNLRLGLEIGFTSSNTPVDSSSSFTFGLAPWYYLGSSEGISAFVGGMLGLTSISNGTSTSGFTLEGHFGAEYWFTQKFSWNGHLGLGLTSYSGGGGSRFGTFTSTGLTWSF